MSNSLDDFTGTTNPLEDNQAWFDLVSAHHPILAAALLGNEHTKTSGPTRPPMTLMLRAKSGKLQAMLSNPEASRTWYSAAVDPRAILDSVEGQLANKLGEWVDKPKNGSSKKY
jgi:hypothetical protein